MYRTCKFLTFCATFLGALAYPLWADDTSESPPIEVPIASDLTRIVVPVNFKGATRQFVLDTGASTHVFGSHLLPILDGDIQRPGPDAAASSFSVCPPQNIQVQGLRDCRSVPAAVVDLSGFSKSEGQGIDGLLGMPFLCERVLELDFDRKRLRIVRGKAERKGERLEVLLDAHSLPRLTDVKVDGMPFVCILDTGMNSPISLNAKMFDLLRLAGSISDVSWGTSIGIDGSARLQMGRASTVSVGSFSFADVPILRASENKIGMDLLRRFHATIDFPRRELFLEKSGAFDAPFTAGHQASGRQD